MDMMYVEDCCEILDSMRVPITASDREEGEYPYYGANGVQDHVADYIFDDELVLLAEDGGNFGSKERPIAYRVSGKCWVNNHAHVLKPKSGLDVDYLCYSLMFYKVDGMVNGATRQKLTQAAMRKMQIPSRSMKEQLYIVDELNRILKIKEQRQQELMLLDDLIKSRFVELFGNPITNDRGWEVAELNTVCDGIGDGLHGTPEYDENGEYPFINGNNLMDGVIRVTPATKMVNEDTYKKHFIELTDNAILMSINGTLGKLAFYNGEEVMLGKSACYCNLKPEINREFVYGIMKTDAFAGFLERNATASTIKNVGLKAIRGFKLILPPEELQFQFVEFANQVDKLKSAVQKLLLELKGFNIVIAF